MSKNKKNFFIGMISCGIIFLMGVLYLTVPSYYGLEEMTNINVNDLFICMVLVYSVVNFGNYILIGKNPNNEVIWLSIVASISGILNVGLNLLFNPTYTLAMSLGVFIFLTIGVKIFTIDYYHDRKDAYYYIETMLTLIFFIIISILEAVDVSLKGMLKAKRFLKKIKLK